MQKFAPGLAALIAFFVVAGLAYATPLTAFAWVWWQENAVNTAYGVDGLTPVRCWALPALLVSFGIPALPLSLAGGIAAWVYGSLMVNQNIPGEK